MAARSNTKTRRLAGLALAVSVFALPSLAAAQEAGGRGEWHARSEEGSRGPRADGQDSDGVGRGRDSNDGQEQVRAAPPAPPQQAAPQADWSGGRRDRGGGNSGNADPQQAPVPQQSQDGWNGGNRQGGHWTGGNHRDGDQQADDQGRNWNHDGNTGGGRNWTDANRQTREGGEWRGRDRDDHQRHGDDRNQNGGYVSGGNYYGNNSGYNQNYRDQDHDGDRDHHQWNRQWRSNSSYNWYSYRSSHPSYFRLGTYYSPYRNYSYRRLSIGFFLDNLFFGQNYQIEDPQYYRLPAVYGPYRWVRYYDDAVLVDIYSGEVVDVINNFFW